MELSIKNEKLIEHFNIEHNSAIQQAYNDRITTGNLDAYKNPAAGDWVKTHPESILFGYLNSFLEICQKNKIEFDLTYNTVKDLGKGLTMLFFIQKNSYDHARNVDIIAKTLAAVLSYIAINEHGFWFRTTCYLHQIKSGKTPKQPLWADVESISVGRKHNYVDFLLCCKEAVKPGTILMPNGLTIQIDPIVAEYKKLTRVDLTEYGFRNLFVN